MAASLGVYETDDVTPLTSFNYGSVPPNQDYITIAGVAKEIRIKNDGDVDLAAVTVAIQQAASFDLYQYVRIAPDNVGSPGAWQDYTAPDLIVPIGATAGEAQTANLFLAGTI
jgi:hypothetical protein